MLKQLKQVESLYGVQSESAQEVLEFFRGVAANVSHCIQLFDRPGDHRTHAFAEHRTATFADRRQFHGCPSTRTRFIQFPHQKAVRQKDEIGMPGLAFAVSQLTISEAEFLLAVPVECFRACPTTAIRFHDAFHKRSTFQTIRPKNAVRHEYLARFGIVLIPPQLS